MVIASTVDQVGSRLLFQGYGVSPRMRPIHAGLLGNDTLVILDEVHLSQPFADTLASIRDLYQRADAAVALPNRWAVTQLSATPLELDSGHGNPPAGEVFSLEEHMGATPADALLEQRRGASKPARLVPVKVPAKDQVKARERLAKAAADEAKRMLSSPHQRVIGVVVNRVATAQAVHERLQDETVESVLLTGRMRDIERDALMGVLRPRLEERGGRGDAPTLVVVATQCIEAGADFDLDGLVTECASYDALRQRFGRVDRRGVLAADGIPAQSVVLGPSSSVSTDDDPVYGAAIQATWTWLEERAVDGVVDLGIAAVDDEPSGAERSSVERAPMLLPVHLDWWSETPLSARQHVPDVARWLHGDQDHDTDVQVVWRADLDGSLLRAAMGDGEEADADVADRAAEQVRDLLNLCPPRAVEALAVPISAARAWLTDADEQPAVADVEGRSGTGGPSVGREHRPFVVWAGDETRVAAGAGELRPGRTIVVPSTYGGMAVASYVDRRGVEERGARYGWWSPGASDPVADLGDEANLRSSRVGVVRIFPPGVPGVPHQWAEAPRPTGGDDPDQAKADREALRLWMAEHDDLVPLSRVFDVVPVVLSNGSAMEDEVPRAWWVLLGSPRRDDGGQSHARSSVGVGTDPEVSSFTGVTGKGALLRHHLGGVGEWADRLGRGLGLAEPVVEDLVLAGRLHDAGKADGRFQAMLRGGVDDPSAELLAKSSIVANDRGERDQARVDAGYPQGTRHEALSAAMVEDHEGLGERAADWDLVRHLVVSHHGWARPFLPVAVDTDPRTVSVSAADVDLEASSDHGWYRLDAPPVERFLDLRDRYGWFRLAWLEAILRLADHRRSEEEQEMQRQAGSSSGRGRR
jgi:CRISPR-associated endonuclease/helicase Cas3